MSKFRRKGFNISAPLKRRLTLLLVLSLCVFVLAACAKKDEVDGGDDVGGTTSSDTGNNITSGTTTDSSGLVFTDEEVTEANIFDFVLLGNYIGIEYNATSASAVTEEEIDAAINEQMSMAADVVEVTDRPVDRGDTVVIDYDGSVNGVAFEGGAAEQAELVIGSGQFIPGFEEQIIGRNVGEEFDIHVTFPEDYYSEELAGAGAVFRIVLHNIFAESYPELTDGFVMDYFGIETVAELRASTRAQLAIDKELEAENDVRYQVWNVIFQDSKVLKYPNSEVDFRIERAMMEFYYYSEMYGMDVADLIYQMTEGMSYDEFIEQEMRPGAISDVAQDLVLRAIGVKEGLTVSEEEFQQGVERLVAEYGYESAEQFLEINGEKAVQIALLSEKVIGLLLEHAIAR